LGSAQTIIITQSRQYKIVRFCSVITDRVVLDRQLQDTIYQFEHKNGVVLKIDKNAKQLAEALENGIPIIITTIQKFPFVTEQLRKLSEERGEDGKGILKTRKYAILVDEAHSSQSGETAADLKEVLGGEDLAKEAEARAAEEGETTLESCTVIWLNVASRKTLVFLLLQRHQNIKQSNCSQVMVKL